MYKTVFEYFPVYLFVFICNRFLKFIHNWCVGVCLNLFCAVYKTILMEIFNDISHSCGCSDGVCFFGLFLSIKKTNTECIIVQQPVQLVKCCKVGWLHGKGSVSVSLLQGGCCGWIWAAEPPPHPCSKPPPSPPPPLKKRQVILVDTSSWLWKLCCYA